MKAMQSLPASWTSAEFDQVFENVTSDLKLAERKYKDSGRFPVIDQGEAEVGGYSDDQSLVHPSPLPVVIFGDHTRNVKFSPYPFIQGADGVKVLSSRVGVEPKYAYWALKSAEVPNRGYARHFSILRKLRFPIAPLAEQSRVVEAIETQLPRLDAAVAALERVQANLKRYRASVLKAAVEGRLVPTEAELARQEGRDYEPASELLKRILAERRRRWEEAELAAMKAKGKPPKDDKWKAKYKESAEPDTMELSELPDGWCWVSVGQLAWSVKDGPHYSPKYSEDGIPIVTGGNVRPDGVDFANAKRIAPEVHAELSRRCKPEKGDILYTKGGTTGIARANTYDREFSVWVHVAVLKLVESVMPVYVQHALNSPPCYVQAQRFTHGVGNQDLGLTRMIKIIVALPPAAEQSRIVAHVDSCTSIIDKVEKVLTSEQSRCDRLRQSILKWAFEGKLVDQDPNDEPAAILLERIRAERESAKAAAPKSGESRSKRKKAA